MVPSGNSVSLTNPELVILVTVFKVRLVRPPSNTYDRWRAFRLFQAHSHILLFLILLLFYFIISTGSIFSVSAVSAISEPSSVLDLTVSLVGSRNQRIAPLYRTKKI
jgi:hypothetical protein